MKPLLFLVILAFTSGACFTNKNTKDHNNFHPNSIQVSQAVDSIHIKGQIVWKDSSITGFPAQLKITSAAHPEIRYIQEIDSLGRFEKTLTRGKYVLSPVLNYHWMGEELVRIDEKKSALKTEFNSDAEVMLPLDTIGWPSNNLKEGVLQADEINQEAIDQFMQERMRFFEIPGATLSLIKDQKIIYTQTYGLANSDTQQPVNSETLFEAGSITKLVFAFAVMRLYERGIIDLDKPLYEYLPSEEVDDERYKLMTARHVLCHQSGMSNWPRKDESGKFKLNFSPGTKYRYSGKAFEYLKSVLESITAKSIDEILKKEVLIPLQLEDMHFKGNDAIAKHGANGHKKYIPSDIFMAKRTMVAYTLQTTSEALAKFTIALQQKKGLKQKTYAEMLKIHSERSDGTQWGLGVRIENTPSGISYGHSGSTGRGFISNLVYYDESGLGYVVLTNCQMGGYLSLPLLNEYLVHGNADSNNP